MPLRPIDNLAREFAVEMSKLFARWETTSPRQAAALIKDEFTKWIVSRDAEHEALRVTTEDYSRGFAAGVDHESERIYAKRCGKCADTPPCDCYCHTQSR